MEFRKMVMTTLYARPQKRHRCIEQSFGLCGRGRGRMIWENGIETCTISYKKWIVSPGSMQDTGSLGLVHWDDPEEWYGREEGGGFRMGYTCTPMVDSCWCMAKPIKYCKVKIIIIIILKIKKIYIFHLMVLRFYHNSAQISSLMKSPAIFESEKVMYWSVSTGNVH